MNSICKKNLKVFAAFRSSVSPCVRAIYLCLSRWCPEYDTFVLRFEDLDERCNGPLISQIFFESLSSFHYEHLREVWHYFVTSDGVRFYVNPDLLPFINE